jgi:hypothetical protein
MTEAAMEKMSHEIFRTVESVRAELDRIEILTAALDAFSKPIPDYEPGFQHLRHLTSSVSEVK